MLGRSGKNFLALFLKLPTLITCLNTSLKGHSVRTGACRIPPWVTKCSTTKLKNRVIAKDGDKCRHVPDMDTTRGYGESTRHRTPVLIEEESTGPIFGNKGLAKKINPTKR